jgi:hypothetical protein
VAEAEIAAVRTIVNSPVFRTPWPYLCIGETVIIDHGPLAGLQGILIEQKSRHRLIVSVHLLQRSVAAEVSMDWIRPLKDGSRLYFAAARAACSQSQASPSVRAS